MLISAISQQHDRPILWFKCMDYSVAFVLNDQVKWYFCEFRGGFIYTCYIKPVVFPSCGKHSCSKCVMKKDSY